MVHSATTIDDLQRIAGAAGPRIECVDWAGERLWIKRAVSVGGLDRLRKPWPKRAFAREIATLRAFEKLGAPVPGIVTAGDDFVVMRDGGEGLPALLAATDDPAPLLAAAGDGLARFHALGLVHGRPALRDMLWDGQAVRFVDFERPPQRGTAYARALDLLIFHHSLLRWAGGPSPLIDVALGAFVAADRHDSWAHAAALCARHRWIAWLTRPFHGRGGRGNDLRPLGWLFARMAAPPPACVAPNGSVSAALPERAAI